MSNTKKIKVYKPLKKTKEEDFLNAGFIELPKEITNMDSPFLIREFVVDLNNDLPQYLINTYNHVEFQKRIENENAWEELKKANVDFEEFLDEETGKNKKIVKMTENFIEMVTTWRLEFNEGVLVLTACNPIAFPYSYMNKDLLDKYAGDIIKDLKEKHLIKVESIKV